VLFITAFGYSEKEIIAKAESIKAKPLSKPITLAELFQSLNEAATGN
jgi:hypothetical protein